MKKHTNAEKDTLKRVEVVRLKVGEVCSLKAGEVYLALVTILCILS